jgi:hypothetical protein
MTGKKNSEMPPKEQKLSFKDIRNLTGQILQDLRQLQREGLTLPDILYNYRVQDGRLVRKRPRRGSIAGDESDGKGGEDEEASTPTIQEACSKNPQ